MAEETEKQKISIGIEGFDPLGLKSAGEIAKETVQFGLEGAKEFLKLTCKPLLEEFGLLMKDKVTQWKLSNIVNLLQKAKGKLSVYFNKSDPSISGQSGRQLDCRVQ